jgi:hypothetical protein
MTDKFDYWRWFLKGSGGKTGYKRLLLNWWTIVHIVFGLILTFLVKADVKTAANSVLLPLAGIFIGLCFAWAGNAQALMQSDEIEKLSRHHEGGFVEYVFVYQTAILVVLVTLVLWGLAGLGVFESLCSCAGGSFVVKIVLFFLSSITLRECWHVVMGAQWMLLAQHEIKKKDSNENQGKRY